MINRLLTLIILISGLNPALQAQKTVGLLSHDLSETYDGYNLFFPHNQTNVYLLNNCGQIVHTWEDDTYRPGNSVFLADNGDLYKCGGRGPASNPWIWAGGGGEVIEIRGWDNTLKWRYTVSDSTKLSHHDLAVMPNGNVLIIVWERKDSLEAIQAGRRPDLLTEGELWSEMILEIEPTGLNTGTVVWEWHVWDHLVQDYDNTKDNFGVIADEPHLIDINYGSNDGAADWLHMNNIDYNHDLNQIILSAPTFDEVWIVDHSTSTGEAAGHSGGLGGIGGDLMYRFGNPAAYQQGDSTDQMLYYQHDIHWIDMHLNSGDADFGKLMVFNNQVGEDYSEVNIFNPVFDSYEWEYTKTAGVPWGPTSFDWTYRHPADSAMYSTGLSSAQRLKNGNTLIAVGRRGYAFEITPSEEIVWEYKNPMISGSLVAQGTDIPINANLFFKMHRYPANYAAFDGRDLSPKGYLELNPDTTFCSLPSAIEHFGNGVEVAVWPNPATDFIQLETAEDMQLQLSIYNSNGQLVHEGKTSGSQYQIDIAKWTKGVYLLQLTSGEGEQASTTFIKQ